MSRTRLTVNFLLFAGIGTLPAQSTFGALLGVVNPGRAEVPRGVVRTTNRDTIARRSTPCDARNFTLTNPRPGTYVITMDRQNEVAQAWADAAHLPDYGPDYGEDHFLAC